MGPEKVGEALGKAIKEICDPIQNVDYNTAQRKRLQLLALFDRVFAEDWDFRSDITGDIRKLLVKNTTGRQPSFMADRYVDTFLTWDESYVPSTVDRLVIIKTAAVVCGAADRREQTSITDYTEPKTADEYVEMMKDEGPVFMESFRESHPKAARLIDKISPLFTNRIVKSISYHGFKSLYRIPGIKSAVAGVYFGGEAHTIREAEKYNMEDLFRHLGLNPKQYLLHEKKAWIVVGLALVSLFLFIQAYRATKKNS